MIGNDIPSLVRTAKFLQQLPVTAIDLNLGCPAPIVYRKCAGGGLLRYDAGRGIWLDAGEPLLRAEDLLGAIDAAQQGGTATATVTSSRTRSSRS